MAVPALIFVSNGNFLNNFCSPIILSLCSNKVKVCLPSLLTGCVNVINLLVPPIPLLLPYILILFEFNFSIEYIPDSKPVKGFALGS